MSPDGQLLVYQILVIMCVISWDFNLSISLSYGILPIQIKLSGRLLTDLLLESFFFNIVMMSTSLLLLVLLACAITHNSYVQSLFSSHARVSSSRTMRTLIPSEGR